MIAIALGLLALAGLPTADGPPGTSNGASPTIAPGPVLACAIRQVPESAREDFRQSLRNGAASPVLPHEVYVKIESSCPIAPGRREALGGALAAYELMNYAKSELIARHGFSAAGIDMAWDQLSESEKGAAVQVMETGTGSAEVLSLVRGAVGKLAMAAKPGLTAEALDGNQAMGRLVGLYVLTRSYHDRVAPTF